MSNEQDSK
ncbi:Protein of unknown function [Bacillus cytotoxicus]|uniref:Uncharacterized protein n=1 Tax=Bacillus cytotoxicus TaxID=580165 RepID=A0AAX2CLL2_9BACI|nr:Protein of unknown function [Bacillus cytotoxicus]SCN42018.1 Protein of unknown function [Bacillus cytotoxicus]